MTRNLWGKLDPLLYRYAFTGASARRYARFERCGFGDLDERLMVQWHGELSAADRLLDVGCGPATLAAALARAHPSLHVIAVEPSKDYTTAAPHNVDMVRARAEALPVASGSIAMAVYLSSIRHVRDRRLALAELHRVLRPGACAYLVELDPAAGSARCHEHVRRLRSRWSRLTFGRLVLRTAPAAAAIEAMAKAAGFASVHTRADAVQPVYIMRLGA